MAEKNTVDVKGMKFGSNGLLPVIAQDFESGEVLMMAMMNEEAVQKTFETGYAHYYDAEQGKAIKFHSFYVYRVLFCHRCSPYCILRLLTNLYHFHYTTLFSLRQ